MRLLEANGITYWLDEAELKWGDPLLKTINRGLATSRYTICFLSDAFVERGWGPAEMAGAMSAQLAEGGKKVLPLQIASLERIREEYPMLVDLKMENWVGGPEALVESLKKVLNGE